MWLRGGLWGAYACARWFWGHSDENSPGPPLMGRGGGQNRFQRVTAQEVRASVGEAQGAVGAQRRYLTHLRGQGGLCGGETV